MALLLVFVFASLLGSLSLPATAAAADEKLIDWDWEDAGGEVVPAMPILNQPEMTIAQSGSSPTRLGYTGSGTSKTPMPRPGGTSNMACAAIPVNPGDIYTVVMRATTNSGTFNQPADRQFFFQWLSGSYAGSTCQDGWTLLSEVEYVNTLPCAAAHSNCPHPAAQTIESSIAPPGAVALGFASYNTRFYDFEVWGPPFEGASPEPSPSPTPEPRPDYCDPEHEDYDPEQDCSEWEPEEEDPEPEAPCDFELSESIQDITACLADFEWDCGTPDYEVWDVLGWTEYIGCNIVGQIAFMAYAIVQSLVYVGALLSWGLARIADLLVGLAFAIQDGFAWLVLQLLETLIAPLLSGLALLFEPSDDLGDRFDDVLDNVNGRFPFSLVGSIFASIETGLSASPSSIMGQLDAMEVNGEQVGIGTTLAGAIGAAAPWRGVILGGVLIIFASKFIRMLFAAVGVAHGNEEAAK